MTKKEQEQVTRDHCEREVEWQEKIAILRERVAILEYQLSKENK